MAQALSVYVSPSKRDIKDCSSYNMQTQLCSDCKLKVLKY